MNSSSLTKVEWQKRITELFCREYKALNALRDLNALHTGQLQDNLKDRITGLIQAARTLNGMLLISESGAQYPSMQSELENILKLLEEEVGLVEEAIVRSPFGDLLSKNQIQLVSVMEDSDIPEEDVNMLLMCGSPDPRGEIKAMLEASVRLQKKIFTDQKGLGEAFAQLRQNTGAEKPRKRKWIKVAAKVVTGTALTLANGGMIYLSFPLLTHITLTQNLYSITAGLGGIAEGIYELE